jgi:3-phosphoshikimate 1-carboxyvinyltransferase
MTLVDVRALRPGVLTPPRSKSDAQRALVVQHLLGLPLLVAEAGEAGDVTVLRAGLETIRLGGGTINCRDGGAPFRLLAGQAAVTPGTFQFTGTPRLGERPRHALLEALTRLGASVHATPSGWPVEIEGLKASLVSASVSVDAHESGQFLSSVLLAAAALSRREQRPWEVSAVDAVASEGYVGLTIDWLRAGGWQVGGSENFFTLEAGPAPRSLPEVPGDWSSLGYLLLLAWKSGSRVMRVDVTSRHPDAAMVSILAAAGLTLTPDGYVRGQLKSGVSATAEKCPDLIPTLVALACVAPTPSVFYSVGILRAKESDRLAGVLALAQQGGARAELQGETLVVTPGPRPTRALTILTHHDHRLAMAGATLAALLSSSAHIDDVSCVSKSFPRFFEELGQLQG